MEKAQSNDNGQAKWTVMVYMAGDNNLDGTLQEHLPYNKAYHPKNRFG